MALGAPRAHVLRIVFESTVLSVGCGMAAGLVLTLSLQKLLAHWGGGRSRDPLVVVAALPLRAVPLVACSLPAPDALPELIQPWRSAISANAASRSVRYKT
jgi:hypothetical protein